MGKQMDRKPIKKEPKIKGNKRSGRKSNPLLLTPKQRKFLIEKIRNAIYHPRNSGRDKFLSVLHTLGVYVIQQWKKPNLACLGIPNVSSDYLKQFIVTPRKTFVSKIEESNSLGTNDEISSLIFSSNSMNKIICQKEELSEEGCQQPQKVFIKKEEFENYFQEEQEAINEVNILVKKEEKEEQDQNFDSSVKIIKSLDSNPHRFRAMIVLKALRSLGIQDFLIQEEPGGKYGSNSLGNTDKKLVVQILKTEYDF